MIRKIFLAGALVAGVFMATPLTTTSAQAMPISPAGVATDAAGAGNLSDVAYVCRRVWTRWGWRRSCWWRPGGYGYYGYGYRPYRSYYGWRRPYRHHRRYYRY
jgi:hypothetical protein